MKPDKSNEIQLTDAIEQYIRNGNKVNAFPLEGDVFDCGDDAEYILANLEFAMKDPEMKAKIKKYLKKSNFDIYILKNNASLKSKINNSRT